MSALNANASQLIPIISYLNIQIPTAGDYVSRTLSAGA